MVRIRLWRMGAKKRPMYRVVVADSRVQRDGRIIESLGTYNPGTDPGTVTIDQDRARYWLSCGAKPSETVRNLFKRSGVFQTEA